MVRRREVGGGGAVGYGEDNYDKSDDEGGVVAPA